jgi:hypothetical protein
MADLGTYIAHVDVLHRTLGVELQEPAANTLAGVSARFHGLSADVTHALTFVPATPIDPITLLQTDTYELEPAIVHS